MAKSRKKEEGGSIEFLMPAIEAFKAGGSINDATQSYKDGTKNKKFIPKFANAKEGGKVSKHENGTPIDSPISPMTPRGMPSEKPTLAKKQDTRLATPKGMSFNAAFREARAKGEKEFDWYDSKLGKYRAIAVELVPDTKTTSPTKTTTPAKAAVEPQGKSVSKPVNKTVVKPVKEKTYTAPDTAVVEIKSTRINKAALAKPKTSTTKEKTYTAPDLAVVEIKATRINKATSAKPKETPAKTAFVYHKRATPKGAVDTWSTQDQVKAMIDYPQTRLKERFSPEARKKYDELKARSKASKKK